MALALADIIGILQNSSPLGEDKKDNTENNMDSIEVLMSDFIKTAEENSLLPELTMIVSKIYNVLSDTIAKLLGVSVNNQEETNKIMGKELELAKRIDKRDQKERSDDALQAKEDSREAKPLGFKSGFDKGMKIDPFKKLKEIFEAFKIAILLFAAKIGAIFGSIIGILSLPIKAINSVYGAILKFAKVVQVFTKRFRAVLRLARMKLSKMGRAIKGFGKSIGNFVKRIGNFFGRLFVVFSVFNGIFTAVKDMVKKTKEDGNFLEVLITGLFGFIKGAVSTFIGGLVDVIIDFFAGLAGKLGFENLSELLSEFADKDFIGPGIDHIRDFFLWFGTLFTEIIPNTFISVKDWFLEKIKGIGSGIGEAFANIAEDISIAMREIVRAVLPDADSIVGRAIAKTDIGKKAYEFAGIDPETGESTGVLEERKRMQGENKTAIAETREEKNEGAKVANQLSIDEVYQKKIIGKNKVDLSKLSEYPAGTLESFLRSEEDAISKDDANSIRQMIEIKRKEITKETSREMSVRVAPKTGFMGDLPDASTDGTISASDPARVAIDASSSTRVAETDKLNAAAAENKELSGGAMAPPIVVAPSDNSSNVNNNVTQQHYSSAPLAVTDASDPMISLGIAGR